MAASQSGTVIGVISLDPESKQSMDRLSDALDRHALATDPKTTEAEREPLPGPTIENWPIKSHPPVVIAPCPHCGSAIEANPVTWEIVIDPTSTTESTTVRGQMQHEHDEGVLVRWPFVATYTPPPAADPWGLIDAEVLDGHEVDIAEGGTKNTNGDPWEFTPEHDGTLSIESAVFQALGGASTCWESLSEAGEFDSARAKEIGEALIERIRLISLDHTERERVRLDQIIYRARTRISEDHEHRSEPGLMSGTPTLRSTLDAVRDILAAVDGPDSPRAKSLRRDRRA